MESEFDMPGLVINKTAPNIPIFDRLGALVTPRTRETMLTPRSRMLNFKGTLKHITGLIESWEGIEQYQADPVAIRTLSRKINERRPIADLVDPDVVTDEQIQETLETIANQTEEEMNRMQLELQDLLTELTFETEQQRHWLDDMGGLMAAIQDMELTTKQGKVDVACQTLPMEHKPVAPLSDTIAVTPREDHAQHLKSLSMLQQQHRNQMAALCSNSRAKFQLQSSVPVVVHGNSNLDSSFHCEVPSSKVELEGHIAYINQSISNIVIKLPQISYRRPQDNITEVHLRLRVMFDGRQDFSISASDGQQMTQLWNLDRIAYISWKMPELRPGVFYCEDMLKTIALEKESTKEDDHTINSMKEQSAEEIGERARTLESVYTYRDELRALFAAYSLKGITRTRDAFKINFSQLGTFLQDCVIIDRSFSEADARAIFDTVLISVRARRRKHASHSSHNVDTSSSILTSALWVDNDPEFSDSESTRKDTKETRSSTTWGTTNQRTTKTYQSKGPGSQQQQQYQQQHQQQDTVKAQQPDKATANNDASSDTEERSGHQEPSLCLPMFVEFLLRLAYNHPRFKKYERIDKRFIKMMQKDILPLAHWGLPQQMKDLLGDPDIIEILNKFRPKLEAIFMSAATEQRAADSTSVLTFAEFRTFLHQFSLLENVVSFADALEIFLACNLEPEYIELAGTMNLHSTDIVTDLDGFCECVGIVGLMELRNDLDQAPYSVLNNFLTRYLSSSHPGHGADGKGEDANKGAQRKRRNSILRPRET